jgi:hypothetical protein
MTGDPQNNTSSWTPACALASQIATAVATQNDIAGAPASTVTVSFQAKDNSDCTSSSGAFGVNPEVQVKIQRTSLPTFFARIWGRKGSTVSATATAEVFNSSNSGAFSASADIVPVQPRCVKPWIVPNLDPTRPFGKTFKSIVSTSDGSITSQGVNQLGTGVIGEQFILAADCQPAASDCGVTSGGINHNPPLATATPPALDYVPALVQGPAIAVPSCAVGKGHDAYQRAIGGCDQGTHYACGQSASPTTVDLTINPGGKSGDTLNAVQCLTNSLSGSTDDMDVLVTDSGGKKPTAVFPFQIKAGDNNPLVKNGLVAVDAVITSSSSIVTVPIYDNSSSAFTIDQPTVTIVGFLQVFINDFDADGQGNPKVTVLNVSGCSNAATNPAVTGTSPVPVRLITPP